MVSGAKILAMACIIILVVWDGLLYLGFYSMGWLGGFWEFANPFTSNVIEPPALLLLVALWLSSLFSKKLRLWMTGAFALAVGIIVIEFTCLPPPGITTVYGIRDHVMKVATLDDLRAFARSIDENQIELSENEEPVISTAQMGAYKALEERYPFLNWGFGPHGHPCHPYVRDSDNAVDVSWGGALPGHWGFSISVDGSKNEPTPDPDMRVIRMSDDIYFYHGD